MPQFSILELDHDDFSRAWPLVRMVAPCLDAERWAKRAEELVRCGGRVLAAVGPDGCFHGVATCEPRDKARRGRVLYVDTLVTVELSRRAPVKSLLCQALERLAQPLGCTAIAIAAPGCRFVPDSWRTSDRWPAT